MSPDRVLRVIAEERRDNERTIASVASVRVSRRRGKL